MKRTELLKVCGAAIAVLSLVGVSAAKDASASGEGRRLKVLAIGNSFSLSMMKTFPEAAAACPGVSLSIAHMMIGGCTLERHWTNVVKLAKKPDFKPYSITSSYAFDKEIAEKFPKKANIPEMLTADKWDVVTIQQGSQHSAFPEKYEPYAGNLIAKIRELAPQARIWFQETWSYSPYSKRLAGWGMDSDAMYRALRGASAGVVAKYGLQVIPTGDAVALYRARLPVTYAKILTPAERAQLKSPATVDFFGDVTGASSWKKDGTLRIDPHHLNADGQYLQACVWLGSLFGVDVTRLAYEPDKEGFAGRAKLMRECAAEAIRMAGRAK